MNKVLESAEQEGLPSDDPGAPPVEEQVNWIVEILDEAIENFDEDKLIVFISLAQMRRTLTNKVWDLCETNLQREILISIFDSLSCIVPPSLRSTTGSSSVEWLASGLSSVGWPAVVEDITIKQLEWIRDAINDLLICNVV